MLRWTLRLIKRSASPSTEPNPLDITIRAFPPEGMSPEEKARFHRYHSSNQFGR